MPVGQTIALIVARRGGARSPRTSAPPGQACAPARRRRRRPGRRGRVRGDQGLAARPQHRRGARRRPRARQDRQRQDREGRRARLRREPEGGAGQWRDGGAPRRGVTEGAAARGRARRRSERAARARGRAARCSRRMFRRCCAVTLAPHRSAPHHRAPHAAVAPEGRGRQHRLADHGGAHDGELDHGAALLPGARGQRGAAGRLARDARASRPARTSPTRTCS